jgi:hypothetical protein
VQDDLIHDASLLTGELMTNAVTHGSGFVKLWMCWDHGLLRVTVHVDDDELPIESQRAPTSSAGRGIRLVSNIARDWGFDKAETDGKAVWFELNARGARQP